MTLDVLITGENIDLCVPNEKFAYESDWFDWYNDSKNTKYLEQGLKKNTREDQKKYFLNIKNRLVLIIQDKKTKQFSGVISLSNINLIKKTCELAIVRDLKKNKMSSKLSSLESISLITDHAFENLKMRIISAGQHIALEKWQNQMELLGYKLEGIHEGRFCKNDEISDSVTISCNYKDYIILKQKRGKLWDGQEKMLNRYKKMIKVEKFSKILKKIFDNDRKKYYIKVFNL